MADVKKSDDNLMAALAYFLAPLTSIVIYLVYKDKGNKFVLFHAVQSAILGVVVFILFFGMGIVSTILSVVSSGMLACIMAPLYLLMVAAFFCLWIFLMYKAFKGEKFKIPVIGDMADKHVG